MGFLFFFPDPMSVDHDIMLIVVLDGKPYLVEISVLSVSRQPVSLHVPLLFGLHGDF